MLNYIKIHQNDNVAVALTDLKKGDYVENVLIKEDIQKGHKVALKDIEVNENIIKYGYPIGHATEKIDAGIHVHTQNLKTNLTGILEYQYNPLQIPEVSHKDDTFMAYERKNGEVGIRNEIWIIPTVGCVNKTAEKLAAISNFHHQCTDGIFAFTHPFGCSQMGDDQKNTQKILADLVKHPNASGVLVLGLGCENNNIEEFKKILGEYDPLRVRFLNAQDSKDEIHDGLAILNELIEQAKGEKRTLVSVSKLKIGLKCGGSDGLSGITANPLVGTISDKLIEYKGTTILSEVPEMFGAETILMNRCENVDIFNQTVSLINNFKEYFLKHHQEIYENPSPGNKKGGISTLEDKSLGCTQKGGTSSVRAVLDYGERAEISGLNLLKGPGNDIVAITGLTATGAHIILFTTGRGTPVGAPVPTVKISTNTELKKHKPNWIDFDAGRLLSELTMDDLSKDLWEYIKKIAAGEEYTKNEQNDYREISIFKDGVTL